MNFSFRSVFLAFAAALSVARAEVTLAPLFTDHAVLQRDKPVPVWGRAAIGEKVTVTFGRQSKSATAGGDGRWSVSLDKLAAEAKGADLTVAGTNTLVVHDVVVGEVWLCSGQSNMQFTVDSAMNAEKEIAGANFPLIRHVKIKNTVSENPADSVTTTGWEAASPATVGKFTAVGYFFARDIFQKLNVPIGLVHSSWGATRVESWINPEALAGKPAFAFVAERWEDTVANFTQKKADYEGSVLPEWTEANAAAKREGEAPHAAWLKAHPQPRAPRGRGDSWTPSGLYNGMISPLVPYALRGALWYQGEANVDHATEYQKLFSTMIAGWRKQFNQGNFPFLWVNLANFDDLRDGTNQTWAFLREAQSQTLEVANTGQAVAIDVGDPKNIHPTNKQDVGHRLALVAKNRVYGIPGEDTGPTFANVTRAGGSLIVTFSHATGSGLVTHGNKEVQSVEVAGADKIFHPAIAKATKSVMVAISNEVKEPIAIRYGWNNSPEANLYNAAGLPMVPFRSDNW